LGMGDEGRFGVWDFAGGCSIFFWDVGRGAGDDLVPEFLQKGILNAKKYILI